MIKAMNQLSKEAIEAIEKKEEQYFVDKSSGWSTHYYANFLNQASVYKEGMIEALTNPDIYEKANLVTLEDALGFAKWFPYKNTWDGERFLSVSEMFKVYQQQKQK